MALTPTDNSPGASDPIDLDHPTPKQRRSMRFRVFRSLVILLATIGGALVGLLVTLAIVVAQAQAGVYIFALDDLLAVRWEILPIPGVAIGAFLLARRRPGAMAWTTVAGFVGMLLGVVVGALLGTALLAPDVGTWAGGVIGAAVGVVAGSLGALRIRHVPKRPEVAAGAAAVGLLVAAAFGIFGATNFLRIHEVEFAPVPGIQFPDSTDIDAVVFVLGDAGVAETGSSPLLDVLRADVERWSAALQRDSAVSVLFPGDNVYPVGIRNRDHPAFAQDSARLWSQVNLVGGAAARAHASIGLFVAGNHDWGNLVGDDGINRVKNMQEQLILGRETGRLVTLIPNAGDPGPIVRDLRRNLRLIFMDTHWFLQQRARSMQDQFFARFKNALDGAGDREVIVVTHHPYFSAGPHGVVVPGYHKGGLTYVLKRAGALLHDLNSPAYANLLGRLRLTFAASRKAPLAYVGGHDHSLQVLTGAAEFDPRFALVSGAGSKLSPIVKGPGLVWGAAQPGYMTLVFRKDDGVDLFVVGGDPATLTCLGTADEKQQCRTEAARAYRIVYSVSLLGPSGAPRELTPEIPDSLLLPDSLAPSSP